MTALLEMKQNIKRFYGQYEVYILPVLKFALAFVYFLWINSNMGFCNPDSGTGLFNPSYICNDVYRICDDDRTLLCSRC